MFIDARGQTLWRRLSPAHKSAFFSCLATGYLVHLYAFTNIVPNSDGLSRVFDTQQMTVSGRWFLHYASALNDFTQMPAVIGLLSLLFLGLAAALAVDLLAIRSTILAGLAGAVMAAFPSMGYTFLYMFTASAYCLAILLAVLSVWLARRGRLGWMGGVVLLAFSMGTYQAYVTLAIALSLLVLFRETLNPAASFRGTFRSGVSLAAYLAAGAVLYYAILLVFLKVKDLELLSYLGMDAASSGYPFASLPGLILRAYKQVVTFFFLPGSGDAFCSPFMAALDLLAGLLGLVFLVSCFRKRNLLREPWRLAGALAMLALLPLGMNFMQVLSPYSAPTPLMKYAFVCVYLAVLLLADQADALPDPARLQRAALSCTALWCAGILLFSLNTNNLLYTASAQAHRATESYATRLMTRIESCPDYEPGMEIVIVGAISPDALRADIPSYRQVAHYSLSADTVAPLNKHIYYYLSDWLNIPVEEPAESVLMEAAASPEFAQMPLYPRDGSIRVLDGQLVVKVQETYTPKSDFEIAYENRR